MTATPAFTGLRLGFLKSQLIRYRAAVANGTKDDFSKDVARRYFKRFPPELPHEEEPSAEHLASVNDALPDQEPPCPDPADHPEDQPTFYALERAWETRRSIVRLRSAQINRWLEYHSKARSSSKGSPLPKDNPPPKDRPSPDSVPLSPPGGSLPEGDSPPKCDSSLGASGFETTSSIRSASSASSTTTATSISSNATAASISSTTTVSNDTFDFLAVLKRRITGTVPKKPRKSLAHRVWGKVAANKQAISKVYASRVPGKNHVDIGLRNQISKELFDKQPEKVREQYEAMALKEHEKEVEKWNTILKISAPSSLEARQECIDGITAFLQPIFDLIVEFTGMPLTFMMGGPEPADHGRLNIISIHAGYTKGPVHMTFGEAQSEAFSKQIVPVFSDFLRKCFTREDCMAASLGNGPTSLHSTLQSKDVIYCSAAGEDYGPSEDKHAKSSVPITSSKSGKDGSQSVPHDSVGKAGAGGARATGTDGAAARGPSRRKDLHDGSSSARSASAAQSKPRDSSQSKGSKSSATLSDDAHSAAKGSANLSSKLNPGQAGVDERRESKSAGQQATSSSSNTQLDRSVSATPFAFTFTASSPHHSPPPRHSSPTTDHLLFSPASSLPSSPTPAARRIQPEVAHNISGPADHAIATTIPPFRCGPPRRRSNDANWHIKRSASSRKSPSPSNTQPSKPVSIPHAAATRTIVPLVGASSTRKRSRQQVDEETCAVGGGEVKKPRANKENLEFEAKAEGSAKEKVSEQPRKRKSDEVAEKPPAKRRHSTKTLAPTTPRPRRPALPRMTTGSKPPRKPVTVSLDSSPTSSTFSSWVLPPDAPDALKQTLQLVRFGCWGDNWETLFSMWLAYEETRGYPSDQRLGCKHRPPAVGEWIQRARSPAYRPKYNVAHYEMMFWKWWIALQPDWRAIEADTDSREVEGSWDALDKAGINGLASVLAALCFWRFSVEEYGVGAQSWDLAVQDVCWVIQQLRSAA